MISAFRLGAALSVACGSLALATPAAAQGRYGAWAAESDAIPANFRGQISYSGTHQGQLVAARRTREYSGHYNLELEINGSTLRGRYSGTGGINSGTVSGTRTGNRCRLTDDRWGTVTEAECTRSRFAGTARSPQVAQRQTRMNIDARATRVVDAAVPEQQAVAARPAPQQPAAPISTPGRASPTSAAFSDFAGRWYTRTSYCPNAPYISVSPDGVQSTINGFDHVARPGYGSASQTAQRSRRTPLRLEDNSLTYEVTEVDGELGGSQTTHYRLRIANSMLTFFKTVRGRTTAEILYRCLGSDDEDDDY